MEEQLKEVLGLLIAKLSTVETFVLEQAPDVLQQFILLHRVYCVAAASLVVVGLVSAYLMWRWSVVAREITKEKGDRYYADEELRYTGAALVTGVLGILALIGGTVNVCIYAGAWVAPKWYIINYFL
jgi:hypothetical protein